MIIITTIGVRSKTPMVVGIYFLTDEYKGSRTKDINLGLNLIHIRVNQESITSASMIYIISLQSIKSVNQIYINNL